MSNWWQWWRWPEENWGCTMKFKKIRMPQILMVKRSLNFEGVFKNFFTADLSSVSQIWPNWGPEHSAGLPDFADNSIKFSILHRQNFLSLSGGECYQAESICPLQKKAEWPLCFLKSFASLSFCTVIAHRVLLKEVLSTISE
jgi:hypothetical protein